MFVSPEVASHHFLAFPGTQTFTGFTTATPDLDPVLDLGRSVSVGKQTHRTSCWRIHSGSEDLFRLQPEGIDRI